MFRFQQLEFLLLVYETIYKDMISQCYANISKSPKDSARITFRVNGNDLNLTSQL